MESGDPGSAWQSQMSRREQVMPSIAATTDDPRVADALGRLADAVSAVRALDTATVGNGDRLALVCAAENTRRMLTGASHTWIMQLVEQSGFDTVLGAIGAGGVPHALAYMLRISGREASSRVAVARDLAPSTTMAGQVVAPPLPHTAAAASDGALADAHISIIRKFLTGLPSSVDAPTRDAAEHDLARLARTVSPEELTAIARRLGEYLDPDGKEPDDRDRGRERFIEFDPQRSDSMSTGRFCVDAVLRGLLEAIFDKYAAPGVCRPDALPTDGPVDLDEPDRDDREERDDQAERDTRSVGQRHHDALAFVLSDALASGRLGQHNGLPLAVIVTVTLEELERAAGIALTATGSMIPIAEIIRLAANAHHYLHVFDGARASTMHFARARRCASTDQRLALFARDRGCTGPGCTAPASRCEAHHVDDWATGGLTDVDDLALACGLHHPLVGTGPGKWETTVAPPDHEYPGTILWHPPDTIDPERHGVSNHYNFPERHLAPPIDVRTENAPP